MCNVIARFPPHSFLRALLPITYPAALHFSKYAAVTLKHAPCNYVKVRGYARRINQAMKILPQPPWMHDVCDGRVARRGQMDAVASRTYSCFMGPKMSTVHA